MSRTSSGIGISRSVETSCAISAIGKSGARSAGPIGFPVPGCNTGAGGDGRSAKMLYQCVGMSFSSNRNFVRSLAMGRSIRPLLLSLPGETPRNVVRWNYGSPGSAGEHLGARRSPAADLLGRYRMNTAFVRIGRRSFLLQGTAALAAPALLAACGGTATTSTPGQGAPAATTGTLVFGAPISLT